MRVPVTLSKSLAASRMAAPAVATFNSPGRFFASAISSFGVFTGNDGCTARMNEPPASMVTGAKSRTRS